MDSLIENNTWKLETLPEGSKVVKCKWVFRLKLNPNGSVNKYKARLVAKGFTQREGIDYSQTFSPVAKMTSIRSVLSIAANEKMHCAQFDVSTAFMYGELEETIYMEQPRGYGDGTERVCRLQKSLYGLKQASRCWNRKFRDFLFKLRFKQSNADPCLHILMKEGRIILVILYVDDGLVVERSSK